MPGTAVATIGFTQSTAEHFFDRLIAAGVSPRVLELFTLTKVEAVFSMTATVEEADI